MLHANDGDESEEGMQKEIGRMKGRGEERGTEGEEERREEGRRGGRETGERERRNNHLIFIFSTDERELRHSMILESRPDDSLLSEDKSVCLSLLCFCFCFVCFFHLSSPLCFCSSSSFFHLISLYPSPN